MPKVHAVTNGALSILALAFCLLAGCAPAFAGYEDAYNYWYQPRAFPNAEIDWNAYTTAAEYRDQMPPALMGQGQGQSPGPQSGRSSSIGPLSLFGGWSFVGPRNLPVPYQKYFGVGSVNGRVNAVLYDSQDPDTMYIGSARGGVWKTQDGGMTWAPRSDNWPLLSVSSLAMDPSNHQIIYAGTGDFDGGYLGYGIMKSPNGGISWTNYGRPQFDGLAIRSILVDPDDPNIVTITTGRGNGWWGQIWRSPNKGVDWFPVSCTDPLWPTLGAWSDLAYSQIDTSVYPAVRYYYAVGQSPGPFRQVWRSSDRGLTWTPCILPFSSIENGVNMRVSTSPHYPRTVYIMSGYDEYVMKSTDAGGAWADMAMPLGPWIPTSGCHENFKQWSYNASLVCSSWEYTGYWTDQLYAGTRDLYFDINANLTGSGASWTSLGHTQETDARLHCDQHAISISPFDSVNEALVGNDGGVYKYIAPYTFVSLNAGLGITQFYRADFHPTDPTVMIGGTQDNATPYAWGDLANWGNTGGGDGGFCLIDPSDPQIQFATDQDTRLYSTTNAWASKSSAVLGFMPGERIPWLVAIILDPNDPKVLYAGTNYLWRRDAAGWSGRLGAKQLSLTGTITCIAVAPGDPDRIYTGSWDGEVWMSKNRGENWEAIQTGSGLGGSLPSRAIFALSVNPSNKNDLLVGVSGTGTSHLWRCADTASAYRFWDDVSGVASPKKLPDVSLNTIARDPWDPNKTWYVGNDVGVFQTSDGGVAWYNATNPLGLPNVQVNDLKAVVGQNNLYAATFGRGMWKIGLAETIALMIPPGPDDPPGVGGGSSIKGEVRLPSPAPSGGAYVALASDSSAATVAQGVTVAEGSTSALFDVATTQVQQDTPVTIEASYGGQTARATFVVALPAPSAIGSAKFNSNPGDVVSVPGYVSAVFDDCFYAQDALGTSGIRVTGSGQYPQVGENVSVSGSLDYLQPDLTLVNSNWSPVGQPQQPRPRAVSGNNIGGGANHSLQQPVEGGQGLSNTGLLVRMCGRFVKTSDTTFTLDDGSGPVKCTVPNGIVLQPGWQYVCATGISSCENVGGVIRRLIRVREQADIVAL
ncbi:MAG: hypothetical protein Q7T82_16360 [Armatimonadota bacterium]|nr:hypothetical protein [Armatimonadota bacterium]